MYQKKKILIITDFDQNHLCGLTVHLNYLKSFFKKHNSVKIMTKVKVKQIIKSDVIWFRSEKKLLLFLLPCLLSKKEIVYDLSSFPWLELRIMNRSRIRVKLSLHIFKLASKLSRIRVLSVAMKEYLENNFNIKSIKIFVLPIPVDIKVNQKRIRTDGKIQYLYVGSNRPWQGFENIITAFKNIESEPEVILKCYGIQGQNTKNILFYSAIPHDQLIKVMISDIDVVVVPRDINDITENVMPIKYAEAVHLNKYVLATDLKVLHEISNEKVIFVGNNNLDSLIRGIRIIKNKILTNHTKTV